MRGAADHRSVGEAPLRCIQGIRLFVIRLDYLSCLLTVLSTVLVGRKSWTGLAVASVNSVIVCVIGLRTSQLGFIPANVFCIIVYGFSIRSWIKEGASKSATSEIESVEFMEGNSEAFRSAALEG
jgi:hypothetical protein